MKNKCAVIGDLLNDRYMISEFSSGAEGPFPIARVQETKSVPGGAGYVYRNLLALGIEADFYTVADRRTGMLFEHSFEMNKLLISDLYVTPVKSRIIDSCGRHYIRFDTDYTRQTEDILATRKKLFNKFVRNASQYEFVIISDYQKGVLDGYMADQYIAVCNKYRIPVFVDPYYNNVRDYRSAFCIKINRLEAEQTTGKIINTYWDAIHIAELLIKQLDNTVFVITLGEQGMIAVWRLNGDLGRSVFVSHNIPDTIVDTCGAGDIAIATIALAYMRCSNIVSACEIATRMAEESLRYVGTLTTVDKRLFDREIRSYVDRKTIH